MSGKNSPSPSVSAWQIIQAMRDGVAITGLDGTILAVNRAFSAMTGYARHEAVGKSSRMLQSGKHGRLFYAQMWSSLLRSGSWQGEIWNKKKNGDIYPEWLTISTIKDANGRPRYYLAVFRDITSHKRREERLKKLAQYDTLTGLPNRRLFSERFKRALSLRPPGGLMAVLFLDLDHFKEINDHWGHAAGDLFLQAVGARLAGCVRRTDTVARWSGDEFALLLNPVSGCRDAGRIARKILRVLRRPFTLHGHRIRTTASIGGSLLEGKATAGRLIRKADRAMYAVKKHGRDNVEFRS